MRTLSAALATSMLALVLLPTAAGAHAAVVGSDPEDGQRLEALPATVTVAVNEEVAEPAYVVVTGPGAKQVEQRNLSVDGQTVTAQLETDGAVAGDYVLTYQLVSSDAHTITGEIAFAVTGSEASSPSNAPSPSAAATQDGVRVTTMPDSGDDRLAPYIVLVFFFVAIGILWLLIRAGMRFGDVDE